MYEVKTKVLISCQVNGKLICAFVFAYAKKQVFLMTRLICIKDLISGLKEDTGPISCNILNQTLTTIKINKNQGKQSNLLNIIEPRHEKTNVLYMQKKRRRSASW